MAKTVKEQLEQLKRENDIFNNDYLDRFEALYQVCKDKDLKREWYEAATKIGLMYVSRGHFIKALDYLNEADDISDYLNDFFLKSYLYGAFAMVYEQQHLPLYALYYRLEAESLLTSNILDNQQEYHLHKHYNNIAISYISLDMFDKAEDYLYRALEAKKFDDFTTVVHASILCNIVVVYSRTQRYDEAFDKLEEIKDLSENSDDDFLGYLYNLVKAEYEYYTGNVINAHLLFRDCLDYSIKNFDTFEDVDLIKTWVKMLRDHKMFLELEELNNLVKEYSNEYVFDFLLMTLENEYLIAKQKGDLTTSLEKHEKLYDLRLLKSAEQQELIVKNLDRIAIITKSYHSAKQDIYRDELTQCYNRKYLRKFFEKIKNEKREDDVTFIIMDVDHFKEYNDKYGHVKGDIVIKEVASIINDIAILNESFAVRYGGDEFIIVSPNKNSLDGISIALEVSKELKAKKIVHDFSTVSEHVSITMGIESFSVHDNLDLSRCIASADIQLYKGKESGRNCIYYMDRKIA